MKLSSNLYKHGYLLCLFFNGIIIGNHVEILVPTLPSVCQKLNVSYELISLVKSLVIIPNIISLLAIGILHDTYPYLVPYLMIGECAVLSLTSMVMSYTTKLWMFALSFYVQSSTILCLNNAGQWNVLRLFKDKSVGKMQLYHLGFGTGAMLAGLICRPFLPSDTSTKSVKLTKYCANLLNVTINQTSYNETSINTTSTNNFEYAFYIGAVMDLIAPVIFGLYHFLMPRPADVPDFAARKREPLSWSLNPKYFSPNRPKFGIIMAVMLFLFYLTYMTGSVALGSFIVVFATDPCKPYSLSQQSGATLASVVSAAFLLGRIFSSFTVNLNPLLFLFLHNTINIIFIIILCIYGNDYVMVLWICISVVRFVNGINYPAGTSTFNRYIVVSGSFISLAFIGSASGSMLGQNIGSIAIDNYPSIYYMYSTNIGMGSLFVVIVTFCILSLVYGQREFSLKNNEVEMQSDRDSS